MSLVTLDKVKVELTADQLVAAFKQLPSEDQTKVWQAIDQRQWQMEFRTLLERIHARVAADPITEEEMDAEVRAVREARRAAQGRP